MDRPRTIGRAVAGTGVLVVAALTAGSSLSSARTAERVPVAFEATVKASVQGTVHTGRFKLVADDLDSGTITSQVLDFRQRMRKGQPYELIKATDTLKGKRGTLVVRSNDSIGVAAGKGYSVITGTWFVVRGTGAYAGAKGSGHSATVVLPGRSTVTSHSRSEGFLTIP